MRTTPRRWSAFGAMLATGVKVNLPSAKNAQPLETKEPVVVVVAKDGAVSVAHDGPGLTDLCEWLIDNTRAEPARVAIAIETPHGPIVEMLLEGGFAVYATNPKQMDRFRDRFTVAGAKDDSRDAQVLGDSLRTDRRAFRRLSPDDPVVVELREWSRMADDLQQERNRPCASSCGATTRRC